jgi:type VI secretion system protein ImpF
VARTEIERTVQPSLLDRLTDAEPRTPADPAIPFEESVRRFKHGVRRDIEWLLNTRRSIVEVPEHLTELRRSVFRFGLPDTTALSKDNPRDRQRLHRSVDETLALFEPRLGRMRVQMQAGTTGRHDGSDLHFLVEALLRMDPNPEQVVFDTVLELSSGEYEVRG